MNKIIKLLGPLSITLLPISAMLSCGSNSTKKIEVQKFEVTNDSQDISENVAKIIKENFNDYVNEFTEAQALKSIHIFDSSNAPYPEDEGDYVIESNELIINTTNMSKYTNFDDKDKANYIMQLLAHEYNHYVDHSYLMNIDPNSEYADNSIHDWNNDGDIEPWPKAFLNKFKTYLKYDTNTNLYSDQELLNGFKSLGSVYNQKQLFEMANSEVDPWTLYDKLKGNEVMAPIEPVVKVDSSRVITKGSLSYLYSMDELFARKMQIITSGYFESTHFESNGYFELPSGFSDSKTESPYLQDVVNYQRGLNDFSNQGQYLFDKPTSNLKDLYDEARGVNIGNISFAEIENNKHIQSDATFAGTMDRSKIRFGGSISNDPKLKFLGYIDGEDFINIPISIISNNYLTNFIDAKEIIGKQLYFSEDNKGTNKIGISETRSDEYGLVSTRRYLDSEETENYLFNNQGILQTL